MAHVGGAGRARSDRAVTTAEYAMVLGGVALVVLAAFVGLPGALRALYDRAFCLLGGSCAGATEQVHPAIDPWDSPDPVTRATWGRMVVLGDSYSSGEGGERYGVTGSTPSCHASARGYGPQVAERLGMTDRLTVTACTGAQLTHLDHRYADHDQPAQIGAIDPGTSLVTISLGGNDLDWSHLLARCVARTALFTPIDSTCRARNDVAVNRRIRELEPRLERAYAEIATRAPHARIVVLGYPRFFPATPTDDLTKAGLLVVQRSDEDWMNQKTARLDRAIATAARAQHVEFVDTTDALAGHELTTQDPWMWGLDVDARLAVPPVAAEQHDLHPTPQGQAAIAKLAERQIEHPAG